MNEEAKGLHPSHETVISDSSLYDEKCVNCGATDEVPGGWGKLAEPCPCAKQKENVPENQPENNDSLLGSLKLVINQASCIFKLTNPAWGGVCLCGIKTYLGDTGGRCISHPTKKDFICPLKQGDVIIKMVE